MDFENITKISIVNQIIYIIDTSYDPNIITLAQALLDKLPFGYEQNRKGRQFSHGFREFYLKLINTSTPRIQPVNQIS